jgi:SAM-dependent methyltransferase
VFGRNRKARRAPHHPDFPTMSKVSYLSVIDALLSRESVERYLEIGSRSGTSIARVPCSYIAIDPEFAIKANVFNSAPQMLFFQQTSDSFFDSGVLQKLEWVPDVAFVDGMHHFEFALRDFMNCERSMTPGGVICLHDVCPFNYDMSLREGEGPADLDAWTGDVWKVVMALLDLRPDLQVDMVAAHRTGLACISNLDPDNGILTENYASLLEKYLHVNLQDIGAEAYYSRFDLVDPDDYIARIGRG